MRDPLMMLMLETKKRKKKKKEANGYGSSAATLRGTKKKETPFFDREDASMTCSVSETSPYNLLESMDAVMSAPGKVLEGPRVRCVLITEGLGNHVDMNYYSAEAIRGGASLFEGVPCFLDHQSQTEADDRPERSVKDKCGYFKNVHVDNVDGRVGLVAELHFDLSETGRLAYEKALTAIHYKSEMPNSGHEYVGLSITADGSREPRTMQVDGETLDVKYVTAFTRVGSVDQVTSPARGGRFLAALVESAAGALMNTKENRMKLIERLKAAQSALLEASKEKDLTDATKKKLSESESHLKKLLEEATKAAEEAEAAAVAEAAKKKSEEDESEESETEEVSEVVEAKKKEAKKKKEADDADDDGDDDKDAQESMRIALTSLLKEASIPEKMWGLDKLCKLSFKEARAAIEEKKALIESVRESLEETPVAFGAPLRESGDGDDKNLNGLFSGCIQ